MAHACSRKEVTLPARPPALPQLQHQARLGVHVSPEAERGILKASVVLLVIMAIVSPVSIYFWRELKSRGLKRMLATR
jgi:hypothetical protein